VVRVLSPGGVGAPGRGGAAPAGPPARARAADALSERLRAEVRELGAPPTTAMFEHVYATEHAQVAAERAWFEQYERETDQTTEAAR
jgi:hypothetical protein